MSVVKELKLFAKDLNILIVEDQIDLNQELCDIASLFFKKVEYAYNGLEALEKYKKSKFHIVLSDITMPNMNGVKLSQEIKIINKDQPIIILSAHSELEYLIELIDIGIHQFIAKPFKQEELFYRLLKVSENIIYKEHYLNNLLGSVTHDKTMAKKNIDKFFSHEGKDDFEDFSIDTYEKSVEENLKIVNEVIDEEPKELKEELEKPKKEFKEVVKHEVVDTGEFFRKLQEDKLVWDSMEDQIEQLLNLKEDFGVNIEKIYLNKIDQELLIDVSTTLRGMYSVFSFIEVLKDLGDVLISLAIFLEDLDIDSLDSNQKDKLKILEFIYDDLSRFIDTVFVYKDTLDVHYLEDSLKSSVEQLKINVLNQEIDEDELELF